jgi:L-fucose mutarotase/ribose pyranase (RbsD/FucU family)
MAYEKFIPTIWNETINRELERLCVFAEDCNRQYEGDVKEMGDQVRILGIGSPTITDITIDRVTAKNSNADIAAPEEVAETSITLVIDHMSYFNYMVGDIDKAQAVNGILEALSEETSEKLANKVDTFIASLAVDSSVPKLTTAATTITADNILDTLDSAIQKLYENDVATSTEIVVTVSPRFYTLFKKAYITKDTDNSKMLENGKVAKYGNVTVKMSNNVHKTKTTADGDTDNIMIRTKRAIAYAQPLTHTEPYRPEKKFADAVKGFILYGAKVVRPKEIVNINVKYA